jgi:hypothetical protein
MSSRVRMCFVVAVAATSLLTAGATEASPVTDTFMGSVDAGGTISQSFKINVGDLSVPISARLDWTDHHRRPQPVPDRPGIDGRRRPGDFQDQQAGDAQLHAHGDRHPHPAGEGRLGRIAVHAVGHLR